MYALCRRLPPEEGCLAVHLARPRLHPRLAHPQQPALAHLAHLAQQPHLSQRQAARLLSALPAQQARQQLGSGRQPPHPACSAPIPALACSALIPALACLVPAPQLVWCKHSACHVTMGSVTTGHDRRHIWRCDVGLNITVLCESLHMPIWPQAIVEP